MHTVPTYRERCRFRTYHFPIIVYGNYPFDMTRVHPFKQKAVDRIYTLANEANWIKEIWLFGSSIQPYCEYESDIDLAFRMDNDLMLNYLKENHKGDVYMGIADVDTHGVDFVNLDHVKITDRLYYNIRKGIQLK